jgi:soluble lytic murein transglycosylase
VAWNAYLNRKPDAAAELKRHLEQFPSHPSATAALYFAGRLAERDGRYADARAFYTRLADLFPNYYYGLLARERLKEKLVAGAGVSAQAAEFLAGAGFRRPLPAAWEPTGATTSRITRSRLLRSAGLADLADGELRFGAKKDGQPALLALEAAREADSASQRLRTIKSYAVDYLALPLDAGPRQFWEYLFPLPYRADLLRNARVQNLDPFTVAGLIRQESEFNPQALSHANAYGLTQVMPGTGRQLARRVGIRRFSNRMLFQPAVNLKLGTFYMRSLLDKWNGKWEPALASYNAGPNRASDWIAWRAWEEPSEFVESIPYTETHDYVQAVLRNAAIYRQLYAGRVPENGAQAAPNEPAKKPASGKKRVRRG